MEVLVIDNYDSFVYNIVHYVEALGAEVTVKRNDEISLEEVALFQKIIISPGPGLPKDAGITMDLIREFAHAKSILGICLGQQAIAEVFGSKLSNLSEVCHGVSRKISHRNNSSLFKGIPESFKVGLYYSWGVTNISDELEITAIDENDVPMAIKHRQYDVEGVQFHPESVLTEHGKEILANWLGNKC